MGQGPPYSHISGHYAYTLRSPLVEPYSAYLPVATLMVYRLHTEIGLPFGRMGNAIKLRGNIMLLNRCVFAFLLLWFCAISHAAPIATELWRRGYSVIPTPQEVHIQDEDITFDNTWTVDCTTIGKDHIAARTLLDELLVQCRMYLRTGSATNRVIRLSIKPGVISSGLGPEIDRQAYVLQIQPESIEDNTKRIRCLHA